MIICLCNAVSDKDIYQAARDGVNSVQQLSANLNAGTCCGICVDNINQCLEEAKINSNSVSFSR